MATDPKKVKKGRKDKNADLENFDMAKELQDLEEPIVEVPQQKKQDSKIVKGKKGGAKADNEDKSDVEDNDGDSVKAAAKTQAKPGKKGRKGKNEDLNDFDMEKELAELEEKTPLPAKPALKTKKGGQASGTGNVEAESDEGEVVKPVEPVKLPTKTKKAKKGKNENLDDFDMEKELAEADAAAAEVVAKQPLKPKKTAAKKTDEAEDVAVSTKTEKPPVQTKGAAIEKETEEGATRKPDGTGKKPLNKNVLAMKEHLRKVQEEKERLEREEDERIRKLEEADKKREEEIQKEKDRKEKRKIKDKERKERLKSEGKLLTAKQKQDQARGQAFLESLKAQGLPAVGEKVTRSSKAATKKRQPVQSQASAEHPLEAENIPDVEKSESSESTPEDWDQVSETELEADGVELPSEKPAAVAPPAMELTVAKQVSAQKLGHLRSAVVCVLGHVDTGKTKILDKIRRTNVQDMEAGGITQQIGATMVPAEAIKTQSSMVRGFAEKELLLPGLLIIDTPGHESFSNLRSRGSSLCDIAILVVDIMHGLEPQTIESLNMLKKRRSPFVVALNKIDRLFNWKSMPKLDIRDALAAQAGNVVQEFRERMQAIVVEFAEQGTNAALFYENPDETFGEEAFISMVPTSAHTGDGMGNLMAYIADVSQRMLTKRLTFSTDLSCTVLEVKELTGLGTTVDVILTNGTLKEGDTIVLAGFEGPILTQVRALLMPEPMRELRVKNPYQKHKLVHGAQGIKILAKDLESCLAGLPLLVANTPDEQERCKKEIEYQLEAALKSMNYQREDRGVYVQASTLGSLEALLEFLRTSKIPYSGINIGPVHKKDVRNASTMLEHSEAQYAVILAFDVKIEREAQQMADELGVQIFSADIIYHLFDRFTKYQEELKEKKREENKHLAIFPCKLRILPQFVFNTRDPIVVGVVVESGILKVGTPLCVPAKEFVEIGIVASIEVNKKPMEVAKKGQEICIKIEPDPNSAPKLLGRHFEIEDLMVSKISRASIDVCKDFFRDDLTKADWQLMVELKKLLDIL